MTRVIPEFFPHLRCPRCYRQTLKRSVTLKKPLVYCRKDPQETRETGCGDFITELSALIEMGGVTQDNLRKVHLRWIAVQNEITPKADPWLALRKLTPALPGTRDDPQDRDPERP